MNKQKLVVAMCLFGFLLVGVGSFAETAAASTVFKPWLSFLCGSGKNQVLWLAEENGGVLDGPFQGPMAFLTDKNSNLWIGDTLNARIIAFDKNGKPGKEIDLLAAAKAAGLASDPVLLDFVPGSDGSLLIADVANNAIISISIRDGAAKAFVPSGSGSGHWTQINRVHSDKAGRIYIEDVATLRTIVLNPDGKPFCEPLDGEIGLAVALSGHIAMVVNDSLSPDRRQVVLAPAPGEPFVHIAGLKADEPIMWSGVIGFDQHNRLNVVFDTVSGRHIVTLDLSGKELNHRLVKTEDPGYDPVRPEWIGPDGSLYMVRISAASLSVLRLP